MHNGEIEETIQEDLPIMSQTLRDARKYEEINEKRIPKEERPGFHLAARVGWMNDPNGFSYYRGKYHMFYQYHPYNSHWGPMHWGHAVSEDLLHWTYLPAALAPDTAYDGAGCFSGSAVELADGRQLLMYTGVFRRTGSDGIERDIQTQCLAVGDGRDYEKYPENPILTEKDMPKGSNKHEFRDPKMWRAMDGTLRCVAAGGTPERDGRIFLYSSQDGFHWKFEKVLIENNGRFGSMWECPDFFPLDEKQVLLTSPMDMLPQDLEYHNGNGTLCIIGTYDQESQTFTEERNQAIDYGIDFYAPQTILTPDGRRVMIGWMQNWDMEITVRPGDTSNLFQKFSVWFAQDEIYHTSVSFRPRESIVKVDRKFSGSRRAIIHQRRSRVNSKDGQVRLRLILDTCSVEVFVNDGEHVLSATLYTDPSADGISFLADGSVTIDVTKYDILC